MNATIKPVKIVGQRHVQMHVSEIAIRLNPNKIYCLHSHAVLLKNKFNTVSDVQHCKIYTIACPCSGLFRLRIFESSLEGSSIRSLLEHRN